MENSEPKSSVIKPSFPKQPEEQNKMEETKKRVLSLPPNYVTLQQLKEQRLKEQEQKQKQKEEDEERRRLEVQRLKEEREKNKKEEEEERLRLKIIKESNTIKVGKGYFDRPYRRNHQKFPQNPNMGKEKDDDHLQEEEEEEGIVVAGGAEVQDPDEKLEDTKGKKKRKKWKKNKNRKLKGEETSIGDLEKMPPVMEDNPQEAMPEVNHEKPDGKMNARNRSRRWERKPSSEEVEVNQTVEIESEVSKEKAAGKMNNRNGFRRSEKRPPSEQDEVSVNQTVEIEAEVSHEKSAGKMNTRKGFRRWGKMPPPSEHVEIEPEASLEQAAGIMKTRNGFHRRGSRPSSELNEVSKNPTDEIEQKIGDLTVGDDKKRFTTTTEKYNSGYSNWRNPRRFGYSGKPFDDASVMWVRKDEKETDGNSGGVPFRR